MFKRIGWPRTAHLLIANAQGYNNNQTYYLKENVVPPISKMLSIYQKGYIKVQKAEEKSEKIVNYLIRPSLVLSDKFTNEVLCCSYCYIRLI